MTLLLDTRAFLWWDLLLHAGSSDLIRSHAASGFPVLVHLNGFAMVRLK